MIALRAEHRLLALSFALLSAACGSDGRQVQRPSESRADAEAPARLEAGEAEGDTAGHGGGELPPVAADGGVAMMAPDASDASETDAALVFDAATAAPEATDAALDAAEPSLEDDAGSMVDPSIAEQLLSWVLDTIEAGRTPTSQEIAQYFDPAFLADVSEAELVDAFRQLGELRPFTSREIDAMGLVADARIETRDGPFNLHLEATATAPHRILAVWFQPAADGGPPLTDFAEAAAPLASLARDHQVLIARVADGACTPIYQLNPVPRLAIGSAFKLWVLLALSQKLQGDSSLSWATTLPIRDELKSLPSGVLQNSPAGTQITLDEYASKMISISDNTATDHLIDFVGRSAVEGAQTTTQHSDPAANTPWFMTRELFVLKSSVTPSELQAFRAASVAEKRTLLDGLRTRTFDLDSLESWNAPRHLDLEWFANPSDLCRVLAVLGARAQHTPTSQLLTLLGLNPGVAFDRTQWTYVGYKGGSEPGVANVSWLLRHVSGQWFSVVITLNDPNRNIDTTPVVRAAGSLVTLLAAEASR